MYMIGYIGVRKLGVQGSSCILVGSWLPRDALLSDIVLQLIRQRHELLDRPVQFGCSCFKRHRPHDAVSALGMDLEDLAQSPLRRRTTVPTLMGWLPLMHLLRLVNSFKYS